MDNEKIASSTTKFVFLVTVLEPLMHSTADRNRLKDSLALSQEMTFKFLVKTIAHLFFLGHLVSVVGRKCGSRF